jgi:hypothetical protein
MIFKTSDFDKYPQGNYYCCHECNVIWQEIKSLSMIKVKTSYHFSQHQAWLYLFFERFLYENENPSRRRLPLKLI